MCIETKILDAVHDCYMEFDDLSEEGYQHAIRTGWVPQFVAVVADAIEITPERVEQAFDEYAELYGRSEAGSLFGQYGARYVTALDEEIALAPVILNILE